MLQARDLHKVFDAPFATPVWAVRGVTFSIPGGQIVGLLGHNGAGKTTTMRMIAGVLAPDAGHLTLAGHDLATNRRDALRHLGYLPEANPLYPEMQTREYLDFRGRLFGMPRAHRRAAIDRVAERCRIKDVLRQRTGTLSKGYKQRVGLAAAMLHDPKVLLLDEPTNGLDPSQIQETRALIRELGHERTMLISSHILSEVEKLCDRVIIFAGGAVRADEPARSSAADARLHVHVRAEGTDEQASIFENAVTQCAEGATAARAHKAAPSLHAWTCAGVPSQRLGEIAAAAGLRLVELTPSRGSLEERFLRLMESAEGSQP
jgi:ABC-2 type transport system ATP-binding protein